MSAGFHLPRAPRLRRPPQPVQDSAHPCSTSAVSCCPGKHLPARGPPLPWFGCGSLATLDARRALRLKGLWLVTGRGKKGAGMLEGAACGPSKELLTLAAASAGYRRCPRSRPADHPPSPPPKNPATLTPDSWPPAAARGAPSDWPYPSRPTSSGQPSAVSYQLSGCNPYYKGIRTCRSGNGSADRIAVKFNRKSVFIRVHLWFQILWTPPDHVPCCQQTERITRRSRPFS